MIPKVMVGSRLSDQLVSGGIIVVSKPSRGVDAEARLIGGVVSK